MITKDIKQLIAAYENGMPAWMGQDVVKLHVDKYGEKCKNIKSYGLSTDIKGKSFSGWKYTRKALSKDTDNYPQETGDCTSFAFKNVCEYLQCVRIALHGDAEKFRPIFPSYNYHCSRVKIGGGGGFGAGSCGVWVQEAAQEYGTLAADEDGVPKYSGRVADQWGRTRNLDQKFYDLGKQHIVSVSAKVTSAEDCAAALLNGYFTEVCSNRGFNMKPSSDGFHDPKGKWNHAMTIIGYGWYNNELYFIILNSWGDVLGQLKDFDTGEDLPVGVLRVRGDVVDGMLKQDDSYVYSDLEGFPDRSKQLTIDDFDII